VQLSGFTPAETGEVASVTTREYFWNSQTRQPQWSTGPHIERLQTGPVLGVTLSPFSMTYLRIPDRFHPGLSTIAQRTLASEQPSQGAPELRFVMPDEMYAGDQIPGDLMALVSGTQEPYCGILAPAILTASSEAGLDHTQLRLDESLGHFTLKPRTPGKLTITAQSGDASATHTITVKASVPRPVIVWDFTNPPVLPGDKAHQLLQIRRFPEGNKLNKENIRGVTFDMMTSPDFVCEDPNASISIVMQGPANWWMPLGQIRLRDAGSWKTRTVDVKLEEHIKAMPSVGNIIFILNAQRPAKGSIFFDRVGLMVR
jgi:hypothetical protein